MPVQDDERTSAVGVGPQGFPHLPTIVSNTGIRWIDYRRELKPHYRVVWRDIALSYACLTLGMAFVVLAYRFGLATGLLVVLSVVSATWSGYWLHALFLFGHEAAHRNLARTSRRNDALGDWFVWLLFGSTTKNYRRTHMAHHTHLGGDGDSETTYHLCMSVAHMLKATVGLHVLEVLLRKARASGERKRAPTAARSSGTTAGLLASLRSAVTHTAVLVGLWLLGGPVAALCWALSVACVFPLLATVRTIVEHRRADADCSVDFSEVRHGAVNRLFGTGLVSRYFGAAGFNRHLLHHWDPAISYSRFDEMERFFLTTPLAGEMRASRTRYGAAVRTLMAEARRG